MMCPLSNGAMKTDLQLYIAAGATKFDSLITRHMHASPNF